MEGQYIYCIIGETKLKNSGFTGMVKKEVELLPYKDIAAVVSESPIINFDRLAPEQLEKYVAVHQKVNEVVMRETDVVPMTFGIIAPSVSEVARILKSTYLQFKTTLKKVERKVEFAVQVRWAQEGLLSERNAYIKDIQDVLGNITCDLTLNKLISQDMLANFSFLIERAREPELDERMQQLGKKYEGKLRFKYIGPMPPYSFSNINLSLGNFELIDGARKMLGLPEIVSLAEIKKAYWELAHKYHPDKHKNELGIATCPQCGAEKMKEISQAYRILESYCHSYGRVRDQRYSFHEEDVENSIVIK